MSNSTKNCLVANLMWGWLFAAAATAPNTTNTTSFNSSAPIGITNTTMFPCGNNTVSEFTSAAI